MADVSRISRTQQGRLLGYQRGAVLRHIRNIAEYLDGSDVLLPNSLILALSADVRFRGRRGPRAGDHYTSVGTIELPLPRNGHPKPAWIVDGQQRAFALARCRRRGFPVVVNAFVAERAEMQREQFLRVNSTKPLPRGLITELLPEVDGIFPAQLAVRRIPSAVCNLLNSDPDSPFRGLIRRSSTNDHRGGRAVVSDAAVVQMIHDSLVSPRGCLFTYRNVASGTVDLAGVRDVLVTYWNAVRAEFPEAWGPPPSRSRLMHGAGIRSMGRVMDHVMKVINIKDPGVRAEVRRELKVLRPVCRWTAGTWEILDGMRWNAIQNVPSHVRALSEGLVRSYIQGRGQ